MSWVPWIRDGSGLRFAGSRASSASLKGRLYGRSERAAEIAAVDKSSEGPGFDVVREDDDDDDDGVL